MSEEMNRGSVEAAVIRLEECVAANTDTLRRIEAGQREVQEQQIRNASKLEATLTWQVKHEAKDEHEFGKIAGKIDELREVRWKVMGGLVVAGALGGALMKLLAK
jgi:hypothetical protein